MTEDRTLPRYPIYIPSKGRFDQCLTARHLAAYQVPFFLVVEPQEADCYAAIFGRERLLLLPFQDRGSVIPTRNWIKEHATSLGYERHWQLDDNISCFYRRYQKKRLYCEPGIALRVCEDFTDRYANVAISGLNYGMFAPDNRKLAPLVINCHVYSCSLILNTVPALWRGRYNEDTDYCLQILSLGWCTILLNTFLADKKQTMVMKGGNTDALYRGDGRLRMARSLERSWPGVVETKRRFQRPQHVIKNSWKYFDTPLRLKPGIDLAHLPAVDEYGMTLTQVTDEIKSPRLQKMYKEYHETASIIPDKDAPVDL